MSLRTAAAALRRGAGVLPALRGPGVAALLTGRRTRILPAARRRARVTAAWRRARPRVTAAWRRTLWLLLLFRGARAVCSTVAAFAALEALTSLLRLWAVARHVALLAAVEATVAGWAPTAAILGTVARHVAFLPTLEAAVAGRALLRLADVGAHTLAAQFLAVDLVDEDLHLVGSVELDERVALASVDDLAGITELLHELVGGGFVGVAADATEKDFVFHLTICFRLTFSLTTVRDLQNNCKRHTPYLLAASPQSGFNKITTL